MIDISDLTSDELRVLKKEIEEKLSNKLYCNKQLLIPKDEIEDLVYSKFGNYCTRPYFGVRDAIINLCDYAIFPSYCFKKRSNERSLEKPRSVHAMYSQTYRKMANELFDVFAKYINLEETNGSQNNA